MPLRAQEDPAPFEFERDSVFQYVKPIREVSATGYNRQDCIFANRLVRSMVQRFRASSFDMERRCREHKGTGVCQEKVVSMDNIVDKLNRQILLIKEKCTQE